MAEPAKFSTSTEYADQQGLGTYTTETYGLVMQEVPKSNGDAPGGRVFVIYSQISAGAGNEATTFVVSPDGTRNIIAVNTTATPTQVRSLVVANGPIVLAGPIDVDEFTDILNTLT